MDRTDRASGVSPCPDAAARANAAAEAVAVKRSAD
jgi:hypothetical protein